MREPESATAPRGADDVQARDTEVAETKSAEASSCPSDSRAPEADQSNDQSNDPSNDQPNGQSNETSNGSPEPNAEELADLWVQLQEAVRKRVQPEQFETWFRRANLTRVDDSVVGIAVQNNFAREWLEHYYLEVLEHAVFGILGVRRQIEISVDPELAVPPRPHQAAPLAEEGPEAHSTSTAQPSGSPFLAAPNGHPPVGASAPPGSSGQLSFGSGPDVGVPGGAGAAGRLLWNSDVVLNPKYTFENFVVGPCNRFGHAAAMGAGESPGKSYNPFFLHGRVGVGKTHLLQAVCFTILDRWSESRILYLSCETFVNHFISALENGDLTEFRNKYRNVDVLVVDDIHLLANKERTQEEFFHTFNTLYNAGKQIVLSSDSPPKDIPTLQERLVSRFKWGMVTEIEPPCYETRMAIVKRKSRERGHEVTEDVAQLIAEHIDQNVRELEGAVTRLLGYSSLTGQAITVELAYEALADLFQVRRGVPAMEDIIAVVTELYGVKLSDLQSKKRTKSIAFPRQVAMYLARQITRHSLEEIGGYFGGRDHSTVLYAVDRIKGKMLEDELCRDQVDDLLTRLQGGRRA